MFADADARVLTYSTCLSCTLLSIARALNPGHVKCDRLFSKPDIVVLQINKGVDRIDNFQVGQTTLGLSGGLTFENLAIAQTGNDTLIKFANTGENLARLKGVQASSIGSSSFVNV